MEIVPGRGARPCECRLKRIRDARLAKIPPKFADVTLADLRPLENIHPMQADALPFIQANPLQSYVIAGRFGTGKSMLMWALYKNAVENNAQRIVACTLSELITEYRAFIQASMAGETPKYPRLNAEELRQDSVRYSIFFDDIDKARPTEYTAEQFFEIVDAIYNFRHQLVVTTNLSVSRLVDHFDRADERFGGSIVRRLVDGAKILEMF